MLYETFCEESLFKEKLSKTYKNSSFNFKRLGIVPMFMGISEQHFRAIYDLSINNIQEVNSKSD